MGLLPGLVGLPVTTRWVHPFQRSAAALGTYPTLRERDDASFGEK